MEIKTYPRIEFKIVDGEDTYSLFIPHGCKMLKAVEICSSFLNGMMNLQNAHEESQNEEKKIGDSIESN